MKIYLLAFLTLGLLLFGCASTFKALGLQCDDCTKQELELYKSQIALNLTSEKLQEKSLALDKCSGNLDSCDAEKSAIGEKYDEASANATSLASALESCSDERSECQSALSALDNCTEAQSATQNASSQLSSCISARDACLTEKGSCENTLVTCTGDRADCNAGLEAALASSWDAHMYVKHYVAGNLGIAGSYRTTMVTLYPSNGTIDDVKMALVGLDYTGGDDSFFAPAVTDEYGLNLVRWYKLSPTGSRNFVSDIDDTVKIEDGVFKVKSAEFSAATSKESLALRRIIVAYAYK